MDNLYQEQLLALAAVARNTPALAQFTHQAIVNNPVCGDKVTTRLLMENGVVISCSAQVKGCALCEAGAGLWLQQANGCHLSLLSKVHDDLANWLAGNGQIDKDLSEQYAALSPIRAIKNRHKCVLLAFTAAFSMAEI